MTRSRKSLTRILCAAAVAVGLAAGVGCGKKHDDIGDLGPLDPSDVPPVPTNVTLEVATSRVTLRWSVTNATGVTEYRVYRGEGETGELQLRESVTTTSFVDDQVVNGSLYRYRIAAVKGALEGVRSVTVRAVPNVFSVVLDGGAEVTAANSVEPGSRKIGVDVVAPVSTVSWVVSEDSTFVGASVRGFDPLNPSGIFTLSPGDGQKTVYARFTGEGGAVSETVFSRIRLDTRAVILSVTEDSGNRVLLVNDVLHITVVADTTGGTAEADIGSAFLNLQLFDDGSNGDIVAFDGSYERDFVVTAGLEVVDGVIVGSLRDDVGNVSNDVFSATKVTIADPPGAVTFRRPSTRIVGGTVTMFWTRNADDDFAEYRLYRTPPDPLPGDLPVDENDILVATIDDQLATTWSDAGLEGGSVYQWGITAVDANGFSAPIDTLTLGGPGTVIGFDPALSQPSHTPTVGTPATTFTFQVRYAHAAGVAPSSVSLVVDGNLLVPMTKVGTGSDWVGGEFYRVGTSLGLGEHLYSFRAVATDSSASRLPGDPGQSFLGPTVTN